MRLVGCAFSRYWRSPEVLIFKYDFIDRWVGQIGWSRLLGGADTIQIIAMLKNPAL